MSELRQDPFTDRWVVIAPNRDARPQEFAPPAARRDQTMCPFCLGNEQETPAAVATYDGAVDAEWQVRVVPNKFPAVGSFDSGNVEGGTTKSLYTCPTGALGQIQPGLGVHEVIVESPDHVVSFSELTAAQAEMCFHAYRDRLQALRVNSQLAYGLIFKNARAAAGASLEHLHSQLIALPRIPPQVQYELTKSEEHSAVRGTTLMHSVLDAEVTDGGRIVTVTDRFVVFCPAASRFPYETWVVPREPAAHFEMETLDVVAEAARWVHTMISRLERVIDRPAYNYWLQTAPLGDESGRIHWRIEIAPRLARLAGFEIGSGCFINPIAPEEAVLRLRQE